MNTNQAKRFIRLWLSDRTNPEISLELGVSGATINKRARQLRAAGVALPKRSTRHRSNTLNVEVLNRLVDSLR